MLPQVGHSTALWLHANPEVQVHSWDIQHRSDSVAYLRRLFPGRLHTHTGDSSTLIGLTPLPAPCDLVHIDGRHVSPLPATRLPPDPGRPACQQS